MKGQLEAKGLYGWVMSVKEMPVISFLLGDKSSKKAAIKQELVVPSQELNWHIVSTVLLGRGSYFENITQKRRKNYLQLQQHEGVSLPCIRAKLL